MVGIPTSLAALGGGARGGPSGKQVEVEVQEEHLHTGRAMEGWSSTVPCSPFWSTVTWMETGKCWIFRDEACVQQSCLECK